jgi:hypothetical protein
MSMLNDKRHRIWQVVMLNTLLFCGAATSVFPAVGSLCAKLVLPPSHYFFSVSLAFALVFMPQRFLKSAPKHLLCLPSFLEHQPHISQLLMQVFFFLTSSLGNPIII